METKETLVVMDTTLGKIKFKLYNDTPQHRDNFIKLAKAGQYDGLLFHRVIKDFMVQGGDVTSKDAPMNKQLGAGDLGYTIPAEFNYPKYFHKKGALCAARTGDEVNPEKASSASQFYIVTGKIRAFPPNAWPIPSRPNCAAGTAARVWACISASC